MSVNASQLQLNLLVYRHLKENGFHSAAEELHRLNPQGEADTSVSLLDIYKSWLKTSKKKKQKPAKRSSPIEKGATPTKDKLITSRKKNNKAVKSPTSSKKSPGKRVKSGEKSSKSVVKAKKLKLDSAGEFAAAGGGDSDSDSSLDVEKWKNLVLQMTEADLAKMETIDALDSSALEPKKKRVRKPRAKPPPKSASLVQDNETAGMNLSNEEEDAAQTPKLKDIFNISRPENTPHVSSGTPNQKKPLNKAKHRPATPTLSPKKQIQAEKNIPLPPGEVTTDETASEPRPKKKGNKTHKDNTDRNAPEMDKNVVKEKAVKKTKNAKAATEDDMMEKSTNVAQNISQSTVREKKVKKKKKEKDNATREDTLETEAPETGGQVLKEMTGNKVQKIVQKTKGATTEAEEDVTEPAVQEKKVKKKKRSEESSADTAEETKKKKRRVAGKNSELNSSEEINTKQTVTNTVSDEERVEEKVKHKKVKRKKEMAISEEHLEQEAVEVQTNAEHSVEDGENLERTVKKKKAKKKKKFVDDEENSEEEAQKIKTKQKNPDEDVSEQTGEKTNADHKKATSKDNISAPQTPHCKKQEDLEHLSDTDLMELPSQETSLHKKKKKKKSKLTSDKGPDEAAVFAQDVTMTQTTPADSHRKKRKSTHTES